MIYEYDFEEIPMPEADRKMAEMGFANIQDINTKVKDILNRRAKDGWEPTILSANTTIWFKRLAKKSKKN